MTFWKTLGTLKTFSGKYENTDILLSGFAISILLMQKTHNLEGIVQSFYIRWEQFRRWLELQPRYTPIKIHLSGLPFMIFCQFSYVTLNYFTYYKGMNKEKKLELCMTVCSNEQLCLLSCYGREDKKDVTFMILGCPSQTTFSQVTQGFPRIP